MVFLSVYFSLTDALGRGVTNYITAKNEQIGRVYQADSKHEKKMEYLVTFRSVNRTYIMYMMVEGNVNY